MFHLELRQRLNVARAFNLDESGLISTFLGPHLTGRTVIYADHEWEPRKLRLTILEGPELPPEQIGMGRGWANANKSGTDVTERMLARAREQTQRPEGLDRLKERLLGRLDAGELALGEAVGLADGLLAGHRASERLALMELAVWELLHEGELRLRTGSATVEQADWQRRLLAWESWGQATESAIRLARSASEANR